MGTLVESLAYRQLEVVSDQYAVTADGMRMFGVLVVNVETSSVRLALGVRNSHYKSFSLALTVGYKVFVCDNLAFHGDFTPVVRRHPPVPSGRGDRRCGRQDAAKLRALEAPDRRMARADELPDDHALLAIYGAFIEGQLDAPKHLARGVHDHDFTPTYRLASGRSRSSERLHLGIQGSRSRATVPGHRELGTFLGGLCDRNRALRSTLSAPRCRRSVAIVENKGAIALKKRLDSLQDQLGHAGGLHTKLDRFPASATRRTPCL